MSALSDMQRQSRAYVWFDAEFTSLDPDHARLLQVAIILTDTALQRITPPEEDINLFIRLGTDVPASSWVLENLADLLEKCRSDSAIMLEEADARITAFLDTRLGTPFEEEERCPVLAGNSIHHDWLLLRKFLPAFSSRLHYRLLDVSVLKLQWQDWFHQEPFDKNQLDLINQYFPGENLTRTAKHDALFDIKASIAELAFYRSHLKPVK